MKKHIGLYLAIVLAILLISPIPIIDNGIEDDRQEIENLKNNPAQIEEILSGRKCYYCLSCCTPQHFKLAEQAHEELLKDMQDIPDLSGDELNKRITTFKPYQIQMIQLHIKNITPERIKQLSLEQITAFNIQQFNNFNAQQTQALLERYAQLIDIAHHPELLPKLQRFIEQLKSLPQVSKAKTSAIDNFTIDTVYPLITDAMINEGKIIAKVTLQSNISQLQNRTLTDLLNRSKSTILKNMIIRQLTENFLNNSQDFEPEYIKYIDISDIEPMYIAYFHIDQIVNLSKHQIEQLSNELIEALSKEQIQTLTQEQIQAFTSTQIQNFAPRIIQYFTDQQISYFTTTQIQTFLGLQMYSLTLGQIKQLTVEQLKNLNEDQVLNLTAHIKKIFQNSSPSQETLIAILNQIYHFKGAGFNQATINEINEFIVQYIYAKWDSPTINSLSTDNKSILEAGISRLNIPLLKYLKNYAQSIEIKDWASKALARRTPPTFKS